MKDKNEVNQAMLNPVPETRKQKHKDSGNFVSSTLNIIEDFNPNTVVGTKPSDMAARLCIQDISKDSWAGIMTQLETFFTSKTNFSR